jgi:dienelactone hydrolase
MAHVILFHSILGLRPAERELAAALEADGHVVALPDLFGGRTTEDYEEGFRLKDEVGEEAILARARAALAQAPEDAVLAGVSFGAFLLGALWRERPRMPGALLLSGPADWMEPRRAGLPVQAHIARPDPFDEEQVFADWAGEAGEVALELHRYDGVGHYFLDRSLPDHDAAAAALCLERCRAFLRRLDQR